MSIEMMHVLGHPFLPLDTEKHSADAQVWACHRFCRLLAFLKIPFVYYGVEGSKVPEGGRFVRCRKLANWKFRNKAHYAYNERLSALLKKNSGGGREIAASMYGAPQLDVECGMPVIEPMVGYDHCWSEYRVFPSRAHQNVIYTTCAKIVWNNHENDAVIPHFVEKEEFFVSEKHGGYLLYLGRDSEGKGCDIARAVAEKCGLQLRMEHDGWSGRAKAELIANAKAVLAPTRYVEPFGYVAAEAIMSGVPVLASDWGAFPEIIEQGVSGFLCRSVDDYVAALKKVDSLDRKKIRESAVRRFSLEAVAPLYKSFFERVLTIVVVK